MIFQRIELYNVGPYLGLHAIDLEPLSNGKDQPIILVGGLNGLGKTTLLDAFRLVLYGSRAQCSSRGSLPYKEYLSQMINRYAVGEKSASIRLLFYYSSQGESHKYSVLRSWRESAGGIKESLYVKKDNIEDNRLTANWDEQVEAIIPLGISNLFLFDGEQVAELANLDIPKAEVRSAIRSLLGLELLDLLQKDLDVLVTRERKEVADERTRAKISEVERHLEEEERLKQETISRIEKLEAELVQARKDEQTVHERFITEGGEAALTSEEIEKRKRAAEVKIEALEGLMRDLAAGVAPLALVGGLMTQAKIQAETEVQSKVIAPFRDKLSIRDRALIEELKRYKVPAKTLAKCQEFINEQNTHYFESGPLTDMWLGADERALAQIREVTENRLPHFFELLRERAAEMMAAKEEVDRADGRLGVAASKEALKHLQDVLSEARGKVLALGRLMEEANAKLGQHERSILKLQSELSSLFAVNSDLFSRESLRLRIIREIPEVKETLIKYQRQLCIQRIARLEELVTNHFRNLLRKDEFVDSVRIDPESYALTVLDIEGQGMPKRSLSAGEKQLLAVSLLWGLAEASGRKLPCIVDTPLGRLDSTHRANLLDRYFPNASHQMIILSTDTEFDEKNVERMRKTGSVAREYHLIFDKKNRTSKISSGYFY